MYLPLRFWLLCAIPFSKKLEIVGEMTECKFRAKKLEDEPSTTYNKK